MRSRSAIAVLLTVAILGAGGSHADAGTWTVRQLADGPTEGILWGVSCPTASMCVAVGTNSTIASSTDPTGGTAAWRTVHPEGYVTVSPPPGAPSGGGGMYPGNAIRGVSCPSAELCVAAGPQGNILASTDPTGPVSSWEIIELGLEAKRMNGISCPTSSFCVAVAYGGKVITSSDPTGGSGAWAIAELAVPLDLLGVSCPTVSLCVAVDNEGRIATSTDPTAGAPAWRLVGAPAGAGSLSGISCPAVDLCVTGNAGQMITSTNPTGALASWRAVAAGTGLPVKGVSCPTVAACAAIDNNADVITSTEPTGGPAAWSFENVIPAPFRADGTSTESFNGMFGISCPSKSLCVGVGTRNQIIASADTFKAEAQVPIGKSRGPRVRITRHPAKRLDPRKGGRRVAFRFRAIGAVARFKCKLGGRRFGRCKSPARYKVRPGRHVFRVFAIGPDGLRGPTTSFHFRVGRLIERPPVGSCKPGQESRLGSPCIPVR